MMYFEMIFISDNTLLILTMYMQHMKGHLRTAFFKQEEHQCELKVIGNNNNLVIFKCKLFLSAVFVKN